jgi:hypothetical protein
MIVTRRAARPFSYVIEPDHEAFRTGEFQSVDTAMIARHVEFEAQPVGCSRQPRERLSRGKPMLGLHELPLNCPQVLHDKIHLHPTGRPRSFDILTHDYRDIPVAIRPNVIHLRMIKAKMGMDLKVPLEEMFVQADVARFNLEAFQIRQYPAGPNAGRASFLFSGVSVARPRSMVKHGCSGVFGPHRNGEQQTDA